MFERVVVLIFPAKKDFGSIAKDYHDACEIYNSCLITTEYGDSILDPKKCNAINFDPIK